MRSSPGSRNVPRTQFSTQDARSGEKCRLMATTTHQAMRAHRLSFRQSNQQTRDGPDDDSKVQSNIISRGSTFRSFQNEALLSTGTFIRFKGIPLTWKTQIERPSNRRTISGPTQRSVRNEGSAFGVPFVSTGPRPRSILRRNRRNSRLGACRGTRIAFTAAGLRRWRCPISTPPTRSRDG